MESLPTNATRFVMGADQELLTSVPDAPSRTSAAVDALFVILRELAPTVDGPSGLFNPYGRIYVDADHVEIATMECDSPYSVPLVLESQQLLVRQARQKLEDQGIRLLLSGNNHDGLLTSDCSVWGAHENHLVTVPPRQLTALILPFWVTRIFGGAGGIEFPTGNFLASVRAVRMEHATGGNTTHDRAIHSTCRADHDVGDVLALWRLHNILGDGHRSQFNLALQFSSTSLAVKAICHDPELPRQLEKAGVWPPENWVNLLHRLNVLQRPGEELRVDPLVTDTQRIFLDSARRYVDRLDEVPGWILESLRDWEDTLTAMESCDRSWLSARLDAFIKYEFYSAVLKEAGTTWEDLPGHEELFAELALLDHSYHDFCSDESVFNMLERDGLLQHRVGPLVLPGQESEPYVPDVAGRAQVRSRFIRDHADDKGRYSMDWVRVIDKHEWREATMFDPASTQYSEWSESVRDDPTERRRMARQILRIF